MDQQRQYELALAALDYCDPASLAVIELAYYDGWHPVASDARLRPDGLNKRIQDNLPTEGYCGYISRSEALAAAAEALGLEPVSLSRPTDGQRTMQLEAENKRLRRGLQIFAGSWLNDLKLLKEYQPDVFDKAIAPLIEQLLEVVGRKGE